MAHTGVNYRVERLEDVPAAAQVTDFDELDERAQEVLPRVLAGDSVARDAGAGSLVGADVINFTGYYRVERGG
ncbi:hypothetical protein ACKVMT_01080 [Halobacteriales archaeon Cl-PHB]